MGTHAINDWLTLRAGKYCFVLPKLNAKLVNPQTTAKHALISMVRVFFALQTPRKRPWIKNFLPEWNFSSAGETNQYKQHCYFLPKLNARFVNPKQQQSIPWSLWSGFFLDGLSWKGVISRSTRIESPVLIGQCLLSWAMKKFVLSPHPRNRLWPARVWRSEAPF